MGWMALPWTDDMNSYVDALTEPIDLIDWMNNTPKVVISNSLAESPWENAVVAGGDLAETVARLKAQAGGDMFTCGGVTLASDLIGKGLLDELHMFVNPTAIGAGLPVFPDVGAHQPLRLVAARPFECGIVALHFEPGRS